MTTRNDEPPAGARADDDHPAPAGTTNDARAQWKTALAGHRAAGRRGRVRRAARQPGPGMIRRPPEGGDAA